MRLDKFISESSAYSRKDIKKLVRAHAVTVNDSVVSAPDMQVDESAVVRIHGETVKYQKFIYLMLNKPQGYISATEDKHDPVVVELIPDEWQHFAAFPVGRLDKDTEGLLLLTNDGQFDHELMSPRKNIAKRYYAELDLPANEEDIAAFKAGMAFQEFTAKPAVLEITDDPKKVYVEISEGKFHQVKRMCERVGKQVLYLKRVSIGALALDESLAPGEVRELTPEEYSLLMKN